jgi:general secretion pathway protein A
MTALDDIPVFSISPNPSAMYLTPVLKEAVARFKRAIQRKQGLCMILGGIGLGKSSLLRSVAANYEMDELYDLSYLHDSRKCKTPFDFLKVISTDFNIPMKRSQVAQMAAIEDFLVKNYSEKKTTIVFVDEAQRLSLETLELIRSLLNYETDTHKLVQFVVAGQLELRDKLLERRYEMLRSRIVAPLLMQPLSLSEMKSMVKTRLESWAVENPFTDEALEEIHRLSGGIPRQVLLLCQQSCDAVPEGPPKGRVTAETVVLANQELQITDPELELAETV